MGFSRQEYWSGLPFLTPEDLPDTGIEPRSSALQADSLLSEPPEKPLDRPQGSKSNHRDKMDCYLKYISPPSRMNSILVGQMGNIFNLVAGLKIMNNLKTV